MNVIEGKVLPVGFEISAIAVNCEKWKNAIMNKVTSFTHAHGY